MTIEIKACLAGLFLLCSTHGFAQQRPESLTFIDSKIFDGQLSQVLEKDRETVEVTFLGKVSMNSIPGRLDKWISTIGENGEVMVKEVEQSAPSRSFLALIPVVYSYLKQANEERTFSPAKNYNAVIEYRRDALGEATVSKITFRRK